MLVRAWEGGPSVCGRQRAAFRRVVCAWRLLLPARCAPVPPLHLLLRPAPAGMDWEGIAQRTCKPPFVPDVSRVNAHPAAVAAAAGSPACSSGGGPSSGSGVVVSPEDDARFAGFEYRTLVDDDASGRSLSLPTLVGAALTHPPSNPMPAHPLCPCVPSLSPPSARFCSATTAARACPAAPRIPARAASAPSRRPRRSTCCPQVHRGMGGETGQAVVPWDCPARRCVGG